MWVSLGFKPSSKGSARRKELLDRPHMLCKVSEQTEDRDYFLDGSILLGLTEDDGLMRCFDRISVLVRALTLVLLVWVGASVATAQMPGSARSSNHVPDRSAGCVGKEFCGSGSRDCRGAVGRG